MRKSRVHDYRQADNVQAMVCTEGSEPTLATNMATTPTDQPSFAATILAMEKTIGRPQSVLADAANPAPFCLLAAPAPNPRRHVPGAMSPAPCFPLPVVGPRPRVHGAGESMIG